MAQWDFSGDEVLCLMLGSVGACLGLLGWYWNVIWVGRGQRWGMGVLPIVCMGGLYWVLQCWGDPVYVAGHVDYVVLFMLVGGVWMFVMGKGLVVMGVSLRDDVLERGNGAAGVFLWGGMIGGMLVYAEANVGSGPTIWTTLVPAGVGTGVFLVCAGVLISSLGDGIAIDRDMAAGVRNAGVMIAMGMILGRGAAGDWWSWRGTFEDLARVAWPIAGWVAAGVVMNRAWRGTVEKPVGDVWWVGVAPGVLLVGLAVLYMVWCGPVEVGRHVVRYEEYINAR